MKLFKKLADQKTKAEATKLEAAKNLVAKAEAEDKAAEAKVKAEAEAKAKQEAEEKIKKVELLAELNELKKEVEDLKKQMEDLSDPYEYIIGDNKYGRLRIWSEAISLDEFHKGDWEEFKRVTVPAAYGQTCGPCYEAYTEFYYRRLKPSVVEIVKEVTAKEDSEAALKEKKKSTYSKAKENLADDRWF